MRENPLFPAFYRVSEDTYPNAGMDGWRRSADRTRLQPNSLLTGNFTGNFAISGLREPIPEQETAALQHFPQQFPKQINRENISMIREFLRDNRESIRQTRKLVR